MNRPGVIQVTKVYEGWMYEDVYKDTGSHRNNLDIFFMRDGKIFDSLLNQRRIILPDPPKSDFAIRVSSQ